MKKYVIVIWLIAALSLASLGFAAGYQIFAQLNPRMKKPAPKDMEPKITDDSKPEPVVTSPKETPWFSFGTSTPGVTRPPFTAMVLGLDEAQTRSDVIIVINVSPDENKVRFISVPRDTLVKIGSRKAKINEVYTIGQEEAMAEKLEEMLGLQVKYYITMNLEGFRKIVDTLGGVEFDVPFDMHYDDPVQDLHIHLNKGVQVLDGNKAEQLVRYRMGNSADEGYKNGDIGRISMQKQFIMALFQQKLNFRYLDKLDDLYFILRDHVKTNIEFKDITYYMPVIGKLNNDSLEAYAFPGEAKIIDKLWYFVPDYDELENIIQGNFVK